MHIAVGLILGLLLADSAGAQAVTYDQVGPLFAARCAMCHSGPGAPRGLRLDTYDAVLKGGDAGPVARPGDPAASELMRRITGQIQPRMPMTGPPWLTDAEVALVSGWIAAGMPRGGGSAAAAAPPTRPKPGETVTYAHVAPIFATRCAKCHTDKGLMGPAPEGYRLTSYEATVSATDRLRVVPGQPLASELVRRIRGWARPQMPFDGPPFLSEEDIRLIEDWITQGARDTQGKPAPLPAGARLRLHGRLDADGRLDGLPLAIGSGTRIDKQPRAGDYVEMRGRLETDGGISVERLRRR